MATARFRDLPDFLIIGAKRGGTTSLYWALQRHPLVLALFPARARIKGTYFLDKHFDRGLGWYRSHFATSAGKRALERSHGTPPVCGEASPYYLFHPLAAERAAAVVPHARIIALLRSPVDRAYSHYRERLRHGGETLPFEDAVAAEPDRLAGEEQKLIADPAYLSPSHENLSYVAQGEYATPLGRWLERFRRERVLVILSEDLFDPSGSAISRLQAFLRIDPQPLPLERHNFHPSEPMKAATRQALHEHFAPHNERLARLLDMDLSRWNP